MPRGTSRVDWGQTGERMPDGSFRAFIDPPPKPDPSPLSLADLQRRADEMGFGDATAAAWDLGELRRDRQDGRTPRSFTRAADAWRKEAHSVLHAKDLERERLVQDEVTTEAELLCLMADWDYDDRLSDLVDRIVTGVPAAYVRRHMLKTISRWLKPEGRVWKDGDDADDVKTDAFVGLRACLEYKLDTDPMLLGWPRDRDGTIHYVRPMLTTAREALIERILLVWAMLSDPPGHVAQFYAQDEAVIPEVLSGRPLDEAQALVRETIVVSAALELREAPVFLWKDAMVAMAESYTLPRHVISSELITSPSMWWTFERDLAALAAPGRRVLGLMLIRRQDGLECMTPMADAGDEYAQERLTGTYAHGGNLIDLRSQFIPFGRTWPDDFPEGPEREGVGLALRMMAFLNSPYVEDWVPVHPDRATRRTIERETGKPPDPERTSLRVVHLRAGVPTERDEPSGEGRQDAPTGRHVSVRFWARGHYRAQWYRFPEGPQSHLDRACPEGSGRRPHEAPAPHCFQGRPMNLPSLCHFLGHDDGPPDLFGEVRCVHCWDLAPPWAHIGITSGPGMVRIMCVSRTFALGADAVTQTWREIEGSFRDLQVALVPIIQTFWAELDKKIQAAAAALVILDAQDGHQIWPPD